MVTGPWYYISKYEWLIFVGVIKVCTKFGEDWMKYIGGMVKQQKLVLYSLIYSLSWENESALPQLMVQLSITFY